MLYVAGALRGRGEETNKRGKQGCRCMEGDRENKPLVGIDPPRGISIIHEGSSEVIGTINLRIST